jgi:hypothetical protein
MANLGFKTPRWVATDEMEDGRTAEELRTEIRAFKVALAKKQEDSASVAGSISTTDEHNFFAMQTDVEKYSPWLLRRSPRKIFGYSSKPLKNTGMKIRAYDPLLL